MATLNGTDTQQNYFSLSAVVCTIGAGGPDPAQTTLPSPLVFDPPSPQSYDAILKIGDGAGGFNWSGLKVAQGYQDSVNLNNDAHDISLSGDFAVDGGSGLRVITIKGGSTGIKISGTIHTASGKIYVKLGDWSDQTYDISKGVDLTGLFSANGQPVYVILGHVSNVTLGTCKVDWIKSVELKCYFWFKWAVRKLMRIPVGTSGPKWLA